MYKQQILTTNFLWHEHQNFSHVRRTDFPYFFCFVCPQVLESSIHSWEKELTFLCADQDLAIFRCKYDDSCVLFICLCWQHWLPRSPADAAEVLSRKLLIINPEQMHLILILNMIGEIFNRVVRALKVSVDEAG